MKQIIEQLKDRIESVYTHLHTHPEISWEEIETTKFLQRFIENEGFTVETFDDQTGLIVTIGEGEHCVGVRADIDALWQEVDGVFQANHSCGHDAHTTIALGTLLVLKEVGYPKNGKLKIIFQPAEEKGNGALSLIQKGIVDDIDYLFGLHLRPIQEIRHGYAAPAILHGAASSVTGTIEGVEAHGARPHLGKNAIEIGAALVHSIRAIHVDPMVPHSAKMTRFEAGGESTNIVPGRGLFSIDLRAQTNEVMDQLKEQVERAINGVAQQFDATIHYAFESGIVAATKSDRATAIMAHAIEQSIGKEHVAAPIVTPGGEDFHYYMIHRPSIEATMLGLGCDLSPGLHHPKMTFNHDSLWFGIEILARAVIEAFEELNKA